MTDAIRIKSQLAAARAILAATGMSPRQLGVESKLKVIAWTYRWGYTSATIVQLLLKRTSAGYAQRLARQGWLISTKTVSGIPASFFTLSEQGLQEAERHSTSLYRYPEINPYKVNQQQIRHYLLAQTATINALMMSLIVSYETERMFAKDGDRLGEKRPDVVWQNQKAQRIAVEIELSAKWGRDLDEFVLGIVRALQSSNDKPAKFSRFAIVTDSPAIQKRYSNAMQPGTDLSLWKKDNRQHWAIEKTVKVPDWLINKVDFHLLGH